MAGRMISRREKRVCQWKSFHHGDYDHWNVEWWWGWMTWAAHPFCKHAPMTNTDGQRCSGVDQFHCYTLLQIIVKPCQPTHLHSHSFWASLGCTMVNHTHTCHARTIHPSFLCGRLIWGKCLNKQYWLTHCTSNLPWKPWLMRRHVDAPLMKKL